MKFWQYLWFQHLFCQSISLCISQKHFRLYRDRLSNDGMWIILKLRVYRINVHLCIQFDFFLSQAVIKTLDIYNCNPCTIKAKQKNMYHSSFCEYPIQCNSSFFSAASTALTPSISDIFELIPIIIGSAPSKIMRNWNIFNACAFDLLHAVQA